MEDIGGIVFLVAILALVVFLIASLWKTFEKAGKPGWACIVPIYNNWVMAEVAGKPGWFGLLCLIPMVGIVFAIIIIAGVATAFGKGAGFAIGLIFLPFIFFPILAFGDAQYGGGPTPQQRGFAPVMPGARPMR